MLQPSEFTKNLLAKTRAKAKMYEYDVPLEDHFNIGSTNLNDLLDLTIAMLGDITASIEENNIESQKYKLLFSAHYFDSLIQSRSLNDEITHLKILGSAAYYLAGYPGSSKVILSSISNESENNLEIMQRVLLAVLKRKSISIIESEYFFVDDLEKIITYWNIFLDHGSSELLVGSITKLKEKIYSYGSDRDLLLVDILKAIIFRRIKTSTWLLVPRYSGINLEEWRPYLQRENSIKELWPAQILFAENNVFRGSSAVIQMPTSAGKTRASELIIRSSFLRNKITLAVIVTPFRALCQEIYNDLILNFQKDENIAIDIVSDVLQEDLENIEKDKSSIIVVTPEKFDFLLRHNRELSSKIGLVIYDEGHLFDDSTRGIKYELLLASLKRQLLPETQVILISAVISNTQEIKDWLIGSKGVVIEAKDLNPTNRSIAFVSWKTARGRLEFVEETDINKSLFFVPRLLETQDLNLRGRERKARGFPQIDETSKSYEPGHVAGFLGCRLASEGLAAIFTGRKDSALKIAEDLVDAYDRGLTLIPPINYAQTDDVNKIIRYVERVLGDKSIQAKSARLGILIHHGSTPHGLRLVIENALQGSKFKTVICTSTLSQGVNLPIRYLIISTDRQGKEQIKVRDFHNLIGRAGRSGQYTEGTIIFANPRVYDGRVSEKWRWDSAYNLIDSNNAEPCVSRLFSLFEEEPENIADKIIWQKNQSLIRNEINSQLLDILADVIDVRDMENIVTEVAKNTLGYFQLSSEEDKSILVDTFIEIGNDIINKTPDIEIRRSFAKSILSLSESNLLLNDLKEKIDILKRDSTSEEVLLTIWDVLYKYTDSNILRKFTLDNSLRICTAWINGGTYPELLSMAKEMYIGSRDLNVDQIVDLCEGVFGYRMSLILGSVSELIGNLEITPSIEDLKQRLLQLQKMIKYGLPDVITTTIYELGLSDRSLSIEIASMINYGAPPVSKYIIQKLIKENAEIPNYIKMNYPNYFLDKVKQL